MAEVEQSEPVVRWRRVPFAILVVTLLAVGGVVAVQWWRGGCHDDYCTGSKHRVTVVVAPASPPSCLQNVDTLTTGGRHWHSNDHAPAAWGTGTSVSGTLVVTTTNAPASFATTGGRAATFTADQGGSVTFTGGTGNSFSSLGCSVR